MRTVGELFEGLQRFDPHAVLEPEIELGMALRPGTGCEVIGIEDGLQEKQDTIDDLEEKLERNTKRLDKISNGLLALENLVLRGEGTDAENLAAIIEQVRALRLI